jgi:hypothetical protein
MKRLLSTLLVVAAPALAEEPVIENVTATRTAPETYRFDVTIRHPDTGWDHYADGWRVLDMNGNELGMRVLFHPHVNEQPFTRSLDGVKIPSGTTQVQVQARDLPAGWSADATVIDLR